VLVFSKTSLQNSRITPRSPRALYFSEEAYVGYVPGGEIEAIVQDPLLGAVFYLIGAGGPEGLKIERDTSNCLTCHATSRTENVPGMLIRSVFPDEAGQPLFHLGTQDVNHSTPLPDRWGGWYVTGQSTLPHLGNRIFEEGGDRNPAPSDLVDVRSRIDAGRYPRATSDIVALMVLEHQCQMHTLLNAAAFNYRRARHFSLAIHPSGDPDEGSAGRVAESWADKIVDALFFKGEAGLGEGIEGDPMFQKAFTARYPATADGETLAEFQLYRRVFKNPCSYMVYSEAFRCLPAPVKSRVMEKMKRALDGGHEGIDWLKSSESRRIKRILAATLDGWDA
jgi:hypothetical protein